MEKCLEIDMKNLGVRRSLRAQKMPDKLKNPLVGAGFAGEGDLIFSLGLHLLQQRLAAVKLIGINCKVQF